MNEQNCRHLSACRHHRTLFRLTNSRLPVAVRTEAVVNCGAQGARARREIALQGLLEKMATSASQTHSSQRMCALKLSGSGDRGKGQSRTLVVRDKRTEGAYSHEASHQCIKHKNCFAGARQCTQAHSAMCTHDQHVQREDLSLPLVLVLSCRLQHARLISILGYYQPITKEVSIVTLLSAWRTVNNDPFTDN